MTLEGAATVGIGFALEGSAGLIFVSQEVAAADFGLNLWKGLQKCEGYREMKASRRDELVLVVPRSHLTAPAIRGDVAVVAEVSEHLRRMTYLQTLVAVVPVVKVVVLGVDRCAAVEF